MSKKNFLIFDFGASNGRASVGNFDGNRFEIDIVYRFDNNPVYATGTLYWDFLRLYGELKNGITMAFKKYGSNIISLGIDTWGCDFGFIDRNGKLISNPIHYRDVKRNSVCQDLFKIIPEEEIFSLSGSPLFTVNSVFNLFALKKFDFLELRTAYKYLMIPDLFNYFLTGAAFNEYTDAATTCMCNQVEKKWESKIITDVIGVTLDIFCEIVQPGTIIGMIKDDVAKELEIKPINVVAPSTHDTPSAIAGTPVIDKGKKIAFISLGTWGVVISETNKPLINSEIFKSGFGNEAGVENTNLIYKDITGLWIIQQCMLTWKKEKDSNFGWNDIDNLYPKADRFMSFIDVDDPTFVLASSDMTETVKSYCRKKGQRAPETIAEISRCLYENLVFKIRQNIETLQKIKGEEIGLIHISGGGSKNSLFCQWISNCLGIPLDSGPVETTSIGNMIMQLKAAGEIKSLKEGRQISYNSSIVIHFEPDLKQKDIWDEAYNTYLNVIFRNIYK